MLFWISWRHIGVTPALIEGTDRNRNTSITEKKNILEILTP